MVPPMPELAVTIMLGIYLLSLEGIRTMPEEELDTNVAL
jgi:hypothetical protein